MLLKSRDKGAAVNATFEDVHVCVYCVCIVCILRTLSVTYVYVCYVMVCTGGDVSPDVGL